MCCWWNVNASHCTASNVVSEITVLQKGKSKDSSLRDTIAVAGINNALCATVVGRSPAFSLLGLQTLIDFGLHFLLIVTR